MPGWQHFNVTHDAAFANPNHESHLRVWAWLLEKRGGGCWSVQGVGCGMCPCRSVCFLLIDIDTRVPAARCCQAIAIKTSAACDACYNENPLNQIMRATSRPLGHPPGISPDLTGSHRIYGKVWEIPRMSRGTEHPIWDIHYTADSSRFRADKLLIISHRILAFWQQTTDRFHHQNCCKIFLKLCGRLCKKVHSWRKV